MLGVGEAGFRRPCCYLSVTASPAGRSTAPPVLNRPPCGQEDGQEREFTQA